eukprot:5539429-Alexandrium_andersonii.AAC.1
MMRLWGLERELDTLVWKRGGLLPPCSAKRNRASIASGNLGAQPPGASGASAATAAKLTLHA